MKRYKTSRNFKLVCAALITSFIAPTVGANTETPAFEMMVISDSSFGKIVLSGSFDSAIQKLSAQKNPRNEFAKYTNLCVAYAKAKHMDKATEACDAAVFYMEKESTGIAVTRFGTKTEQRTMQSNLAIALSNRGVLFAIRGNLDRAKMDFHAAMKLKVRDEVVANNLARMNYSPFDA